MQTGMVVRPSEAKAWAKQNLKGIITSTIPTYTQDMKYLNEKAIAHDIDLHVKQGFLGTSIITEAGTNPDETKQFIDICVKHSKNRIMTSLLTTFSSPALNMEMAAYAKEAGVDLIQLGYPAMWHPNSLDEVVKYTEEVCKTSGLPTILWAANMWGWTELLPDPNNYPRELLLKLSDIPNIVGMKGATGDHKIWADIHSRGVVPGHVVESLWPFWMKKFGGQWGGISVYNHVYHAPQYFRLMLDGKFEQGMELYWKMAPVRKAWEEVILVEVGGNNPWGWTGHNRLRWKYVQWLVGGNGSGPRSRLRTSR